MTAPTPMITPSIVKSDRALFAKREDTAVLKVSNICISPSFKITNPRRGRGPLHPITGGQRPPAPPPKTYAAGVWGRQPPVTGPGPMALAPPSPPEDVRRRGLGASAPSNGCRACGPAVFEVEGALGVGGDVRLVRD